MGTIILGQVLYTGKDFIIIDFEGEPARPISVERLKQSPLRDVARYAPVVSLCGLYHPARADR